MQDLSRIAGIEYCYLSLATFGIAGLMQHPDSFWNAALEALYPDREEMWSACCIYVYMHIIRMHILNILIHMQDSHPPADKMLADVVANIEMNGICKHFSDMFARGEGGTHSKVAWYDVFTFFGVPAAGMIEIQMGLPK